MAGAPQPALQARWQIRYENNRRPHLLDLAHIECVDKASDLFGNEMHVVDGKRQFERR